MNNDKFKCINVLRTTDFAMGENENKVSPEKKNGTENNVIRFPESDENDPCIDCKKQPSSAHRKGFWFEKEHQLIEKTSLTRRGLRLALVLLLVSLLFFVIIVILAALWPRKPHHLQFPVCTEPQCLKAAVQIRESLNSSVYPCDDLWSWACGRWLEKNPLPADRSIWNQEAELALQEARRVRELVNTLPLPLHTGTVEWKLKYLYEACLDVDSVNADQARPLQNIISELGGWYVLRDFNMADFNYKTLLTNLHVKYGAAPYFKVTVKPNPYTPGKNVIAIFPSGLGLPDKSYYYQDDDNLIQTAYTQFIRDIIINLSVTKTDAEKFSTDMFYYEKRIAEITPNSFELMNMVNTYNLVKLSELHYTLSMLPLQDILAALYPDANINEDTDVLVSSLDYLQKVSQIISTTDRTTLNSYIMWTLVREYVPYLSTPFTASLNNFKRDLLGIKRSVPRWEECSNLVYRFAGLAVESLFGKERSLRNKTEVVNRLFQSIRNAVKVYIDKYRETPDFYQHLSKKISGLKIQIGLPEYVLSANHLKQYYSKLIVIKTNLFENYRHGIEFLRKLEGQRLVNSEPENVLIDYALSQPLSTSYIPSENTIFVPRVVLTEPFFDTKYPSSILYGRLGVQIANSVISSITPFHSGWSSNLKLFLPVNFIVNESLRISQEPRDCLSKYFIENNMASDVSATVTSLSVLKELSAIKFAFFGLITTLQNEEHIHQPTLEEFEDDSLFFLTYSQTRCSVLSTQQDFYMKTVEFELPQQSILKTASDHFAPFLESLNCPSSKKTHCDDIL
ncbi:protein gone early-like isoform X2 [Agrilus planipennis]|uniref:Protein gone early-like isoform X2 n=1 Tax=Agrilus planipennis TaxID=224129 RepID=A0A7F5R301_AGRPL|nr:protein gone early-like isoform X2 [Agrilus planipennis]